MLTDAERRPSGLPVPESTKSFWHTEPSSLLLGHRTTRELPAKADIVIIGSGITGSSIARHLLDHDKSMGFKIVMLEAREACWGATGRNGGHCQPLVLKHVHNPSIGRFERRNYLALADLVAEEKIDCEFVRQPSVRGLYDDAKLERAKAKMAAFQQTVPEMAHMTRIITSKDELAKYRVPTAKGAVYFEQAARLWPYKLVAHVLEDLLQRPLLGSFNLQTLTPVNKIKQRGQEWTVSTTRGDIHAGAVFLATNGYTSHLLPDWKDLIIPCRGQMSAQLPTPSLAGEHRLTTSMGTEGVDMDEYLIQRSSKEEQLMYGGGRHLAPSLDISDDSEISEKVAKHLRTALPERMQLKDGQPELKATHEWTGIMGWSRDGMPWVGPVPQTSNLYVSAGYTGHGMPNAWLCGKAATEMFFEEWLGLDAAAAHAQAVTGLPDAYLVTPARQAKALAGNVFMT